MEANVKRLRRIGAWLLELAGIGLVVAACTRIAPELGMAAGGLALLALGYAVYDDRK